MTYQESLTKIRLYGYDELDRLWQQVQIRTTADKGWPSGKAFELLLLQAFALEGADVTWPYTVNLFGSLIEEIDGVVHLPNSHLSVLIEAKDHETGVNISPIVKMRSQLQRRPGGIIGSVFSVGGFTEPALTLTQFMAPQTILLWNAQDIDYALLKRNFVPSLQLKYRYCIEQGNPVFDIKPLDS